MSYDFSIGAYSSNYTSNVGPMFRAIYKNEGIKTIDGLTGAEAEDVLRHLYIQMINRTKELEAMNPENGWGSLEGALKLVYELTIKSMRFPQEVWSVTS